MSEPLPDPDPPHDVVEFGAVLARIGSAEVVEFHHAGAVPTKTGFDARDSARRSLTQPLGFPSIDQALVPGDRVALAIDPSLPDLVPVVSGLIDAFQGCQLAGIDLVVWDEADESTLSHLEASFGDRHTIIRHRCDDREALRFVAADDDGEPLLMCRALVDAEFAVPVVARRSLDRMLGRHLAGVFPMLADSATRTRFRHAMGKAGQAMQLASEDATRSASGDSEDSLANEPPSIAIDEEGCDLDGFRQLARTPSVDWLLGVQVMVTVVSDSDGHAAAVQAGTLDEIAKAAGPLRLGQDEFPPQTEMLVASLDGAADQQTWINVARAARAASRYVLPDGLIVVWSDIAVPPSRALIRMGQAVTDELESLDVTDPLEVPDDRRGSRSEGEASLPRWNESLEAARVLSDVLQQHRVLIRSRLPQETIELIGMGVIDDEASLHRLTRGFASCGVLRAAQFADGVIDLPPVFFASRR
ncbi:MAG: hypothetical protein AAGA03_04770 [Planctomycetota bacterium]